MSRAFISIKSNIGNPSAQVLQALADIGSIPNSELLACSSLYWSAPFGNGNQPCFINAVAEIETALLPYTLLSILHQIELVHGGVGNLENGPRILGLDLLLYDDLVLKDEKLTLPHPRIHERAFMLIPLIEISPNCRIPGYDLAAHCLANCSGQKVGLFEG